MRPGAAHLPLPLTKTMLGSLACLLSALQLLDGPLHRTGSGKSIRVIHGGKTLDNDLTLEAAGMRDQAYVHAVVSGEWP